MYEKALNSLCDSCTEISKFMLRDIYDSFVLSCLYIAGRLTTGCSKPDVCLAGRKLYAAIRCIESGSGLNLSMFIGCRQMDGVWVYDSGTFLNSTCYLVHSAVHFGDDVS